MAEQQPGRADTRRRKGPAELLDVVALGRLPAQAGEQVMGAGIAGGEGDQRLQGSLGLVRPAQEVERRREVVAVFRVPRFEPHRLGEMGEGGGMVAEAGIDAAHRIAAERVGGRGLLGFSQRLRRVPVAADQGEELGELGAVFALRI